MVINIADSVVI